MGFNDSFAITSSAVGTGLAAGVALTTAQVQLLAGGTATDVIAVSGQLRFLLEADKRQWSDTNPSGAGGLPLLADPQNGEALSWRDLVSV